MLHAAAMLIGLFALGLLATQRLNSMEDALLVFGVAAVCVAVGARFGGIGPNPFSHAPQWLFLIGGRIRESLRGAWRTSRAALAADVSANPALVRVRTPRTAFTKAALVSLASSSAGSVVATEDAEGVLVHVLDEDDVEEAELRALEAQVARALEPGS